jgi:50S ribosomal protein L16 3-hydroxylase
VWFQPGRGAAVLGARTLVLDRRTRMLYDAQHVYINGESFVAAGRDAQCLRRLADARQLDPGDVRRLSRAARNIVQQWLSTGWIHECRTAAPKALTPREPRRGSFRALEDGPSGQGNQHEG